MPRSRVRCEVVCGSRRPRIFFCPISARSLLCLARALHACKQRRQLRRVRCRALVQLRQRIRTKWLSVDCCGGGRVSHVRASRMQAQEKRKVRTFVMKPSCTVSSDASARETMRPHMNELAVPTHHAGRLAGLAVLLQHVGGDAVHRQARRVRRQVVALPRAKCARRICAPERAMRTRVAHRTTKRQRASARAPGPSITGI
jgi:hypothetical protein